MREQFPQTPRKYRADIDGLRGVAILLVVFFHAFPDYLPGGFIGVDIFFVISGFLITSIILSALDLKEFKLLDFYIRRIRRIIPSLVIVLLACLLFGWYMLFSDEYALLGRHTMAGAGFVQNLVLWRESGYFDSAAHTKPLLHLWSLAIEEQFYIIWPFLLILVWFVRWSFLKVTILIAVISFGANVYLVDVDPVAAFFLPISRFWELMIGGILAFFVYKGQPFQIRSGGFQSLAGLVLIIVASALLDESSSFPGWWALLPVFGAFLIIAAGECAWLNRWVLASEPMVWVGKISYPLYLWHWPLIIFPLIVYDMKLSGKFKVAIIALAFVLAWVTYRFVELPIRRQQPNAKTAWFWLAVLGVFFLFGLAIDQHIFLPRIKDSAVQTLVSPRMDWDYPGALEPVSFYGAAYANRYCEGECLTTLFLGDSHVAQYAPRVVTLGKEKDIGRAIFSVSVGCLPIPGIANARAPACDLFRQSLASKALTAEVDRVVVGGCWNCFLTSNEFNQGHIGEAVVEPERRRHALELLESFLLRVKAAGKGVFLLLDNHAGVDVSPDYYLSGNRLGEFETEPIPRKIALPTAQKALREELLSIAHRGGFRVVDPIARWCSEDRLCAVTDRFGQPLFKDSDHLRASVVKEQANYIDEVFY